MKITLNFFENINIRYIGENIARFSSKLSKSAERVIRGLVSDNRLKKPVLKAFGVK